MMKRSLSLLFFAVLFTFPVTAQEYGTGKDSVKCIEKLTVYRSFRKNKEYRKAVPYWKKAIELCPRASKRLYVDGETFYETFIKKTGDTAKKKAYLDTLMWVYDKWVEAYGEKAKVLGKKGSHYVKYRDFLPPSKLVKGNRMLAKSVHRLKKKAFPPDVGRYFTSLYFLYQIDSVSLRKIAMEYVPISLYVDQNIRNPRNEKYKRFYQKKIRPKIDKVFKALTDCKMLKKHYGNWLKKDSALTPQLKKQMMLALKTRRCTDNELYPKLAKTVYKEDPSASSAYQIGVLEKDRGNHKEAAKYFQEAIKLLKKDTGKVDSSRLAEYYIQAGRNANERGLATKADEYARKAKKIDSDSPWPYLIIGEAIASSSESCGKNKLEKKAVYWLAADYVKKAREKVGKNDTDLQGLVEDRLGRYRANFPGKDPMFTHQLLNDNGEPIDKPFKIGCWIGESTRPRKSW